MDDKPEHASRPPAQPPPPRRPPAAKAKQRPASKGRVRKGKARR